MSNARTILGTLCQHKHEHADSGMSLRHLRLNGTTADCVVCRKESRKARYAATQAESKASAAAWYAAHRDEAKVRVSLYYQKHREQLLEYQKDYRNANPDVVAERKRAYYKANSDRLKAKSRELYYDDHEGELQKRQEWRDANRDLIRAQARAYGQNPKQKERVRKTSAAYRARKSLCAGTVTQERKDRLLAAYNNCCAVCSVPMTNTSRRTPTSFTWDHIVPLSMGGRDDDSNLLPMCQSCNSTKGKKSLLGWLGFHRTLEVLDAIDRAA